MSTTVGLSRRMVLRNTRKRVLIRKLTSLSYSSEVDILVVIMAWKLPANPAEWHPNKKFCWSRKALFKLHVVFRMSPKHIAEVHDQMFGLTIHPQGVREYLKAYDFYRPPAKEQGRYTYTPDFKGLREFVSDVKKILRNSKN